MTRKILNNSETNIGILFIMISQKPTDLWMISDCSKSLGYALVNINMY